MAHIRHVTRHAINTQPGANSAGRNLLGCYTAHDAPLDYIQLFLADGFASIALPDTAPRRGSATRPQSRHSNENARRYEYAH